MKRLLRISLAIILTANFSVAGQSDSITPGDSLSADGIPNIPASIAQKVKRYTNAYGFRLAGWDSTNREVLLKNLAGSETWILRATAGSAPKIISLIPTGVYDLYYQPQAKYLVYNKDVDGDDSFQFYLYDIAARKSTLITDGKSRNTEPVWSNAGDRIVYIGRTVRGVFLLKNQLEALVRTRIRAIKAINQRLKNGIFDLDADLRDFEEYLKDSIGRTSQDTVANLERLARMDNQLERMQYDMETASARRAGAEAQKKEAQKNLDVELSKPESQRCAACISDLKQEISNCELLITQLDAEISRLQAEIVTRTRKYNVILDERAKFGEQVQSANDAWQKFNIDKDALDKLLDEIEGRNTQPQP